MIGRRKIIRESDVASASAQANTAALKQQVIGGGRAIAKKRKFGPKSTTLAAYSGVFLLVMTMVAIGYQSPQKVDTVANISGVSQTAKTDQPSVDQVVATAVASDIASDASLPVASNIANQTVSLKVKSQLAQTADSTTIVKPQVIQSASGDRTVKTYVAVKGDTVKKVAEQFGISTDTLKWANNLTSNDLSKGKKLTILPVDGVLHTVGNGDTLKEIASKYKVSEQTVTTFNNLELSGITKGAKIVVPGGVLPEVDRPGYVAPSINTGYNPTPGYPYGTVRFAGGFGGGSLTVINPYTLISSSRNIYNATNGGMNGQCTWWAIERRAAMGRPLPGGALGNAADWIYTLAGRYTINRTPAVGAVIQNGGGYGHVGVVEEVHDDGSITISEMNNYAAGGSFVVDLRTIPASAVGNFNYIH